MYMNTQIYYHHANYIQSAGRYRPDRRTFRIVDAAAVAAVFEQVNDWRYRYFERWHVAEPPNLSRAYFRPTNPSVRIRKSGPVCLFHRRDRYHLHQNRAWQ